MGKRVFRSDCEKKLSEADDLKVYIKSTRVSYWVLLIALVIFFLGIASWMLFGKVHVNIDAICDIKNGTLNIYYDTEEERLVRPGFEVKGLPGEYKIPESASDPAYVYASELSDFEREKAGFDESGILCHITDKTDMADGIYDIEIVTEEVIPFRLIFG